jgi:hypothetical protein
MRAIDVHPGVGSASFIQLKIAFILTLAAEHGELELVRRSDLTSLQHALAVVLPRAE